MALPVTLQGELRLPRAFFDTIFTPAMAEIEMAEIERHLQAYGLLPVQTQERRWRMDPDNPGGYLLQYTFVVSEEMRP